MTASELLAMLGRAWSRLLLYPGGLTAFATAWLTMLFLQREPRTGTRRVNQEPAHHQGSQFPVLSTANHKFDPSSPDDGRSTIDDAPPSIVDRRSSKVGTHVRFDALSSIVLPWLALALLPLPLAVALPRQVDIVVTLALLEWPQVLAIRQALRASDMRRLAAALNSYPPLILATLALAQSAGSLEVVALARPPGELASAGASALHWIGAVALALALAPALGMGPFGDRRPTTDDRRPTTDDRPFDTAQGRRPTTDDEAFSQPPTPNPQPPTPNPQIGLRLRALGLIALAALPWAGDQGDRLALLRMLVAASLIAALLWSYDRLTRKHAARRWAQAYLALDGALLLALLWAAYLALESRLA